VERRQGSGTYAAEGPGGGRLSQVALLIDGDLKLGDDPFFSLLTERLQMCLQTAGVRCVMERIDGRGRPRFLGDGAITLGVAGAGALAALRVGDPPAVGLLTGEDARTNGRVSLLVADDHGAGRAAARRLLGEGRTRLFFLGRGGLPASRARLDGARAEAEAAGATVTHVECSLNHRAGRAAAVEVVSLLGGVADGAGLIAANDWLAVGLRAGLAESAPASLRSLPLVSFDGLPMAAADPSLGVRSLAFPAEAVAADALAEIRRLSAPRAVGRTIRYPMAWADGHEG
jgi:DNA-binding LacI/PurR family transcriptional regulator